MTTHFVKDKAYYKSRRVIDTGLKMLSVRYDSTWVKTYCWWQVAGPCEEDRPMDGGKEL